MKLSEYATYDALALAELVAKKQISVQELSQVGKKSGRYPEQQNQCRCRELGRGDRPPC